MICFANTPTSETLRLGRDLYYSTRPMSPRTRKFAAEAPTAEGDRIREGQAGGGSPGEAQPAIGSDAAAEAATSTSDAEAAAGTVDVDREGSFVLLVLDGSITAEYVYGLADEVPEQQVRVPTNDGAVTKPVRPVRKVRPRLREDRVIRKGEGGKRGDLRVKKAFALQDRACGGHASQLGCVYGVLLRRPIRGFSVVWWVFRGERQRGQGGKRRACDAYSLSLAI